MKQLGRCWRGSSSEAGSEGAAGSIGGGECYSPHDLPADGPDVNYTSDSRLVGGEGLLARWSN